MLPLPEHHGETKKETATMKQAKAAIGHQDKPHCADPNIERPLNKGINGYAAL